MGLCWPCDMVSHGSLCVCGMDMYMSGYQELWVEKKPKQSFEAGLKHPHHGLHWAQQHLECSAGFCP